MQKIRGYKKLTWQISQIEKIMANHKTATDKIKAIREVLTNVPKEQARD